MKRLTTTTEVFEALGGDAGVARLTNASLKAVWNWHGTFDAFPPNTYFVMTQALARRGLRASPHLWKMRGVEKRAA